MKCRFEATSRCADNGSGGEEDSLGAPVPGIRIAHTGCPLTTCALGSSPRDAQHNTEAPAESRAKQLVAIFSRCTTHQGAVEHGVYEHTPPPALSNSGCPYGHPHTTPNPTPLGRRQRDDLRGATPTHQYSSPSHGLLEIQASRIPEHKESLRATLGHAAKGAARTEGGQRRPWLVSGKASRNHNKLCDRCARCAASRRRPRCYVREHRPAWIGGGRAQEGAINCGNAGGMLRH